jgi:transcription initiation factor TFIIIB Brf1 subunit/transcription initiation factor TFIIB
MNCPECAGELKFDRNRGSYVCLRCGATWKREELDEAREKLMDQIYGGSDKEKEGKSKRQKEYLDWWTSKEKKK